MRNHNNLPTRTLITLRRKQRAVVATCGAIAATLGSGNAFAAVTWDGGGSSPFNWTDNANWTTVAPTPSAAETLTFAGVLGLTNTNDFAANSQFNTITFGATAGAFNLTGNAINLGNGTAGTKITNSSANSQTIGLNIALLQTPTTIATGSTVDKGIVLGGNISGGGFGLTTTQAGGLTLSGSNSYSGATIITGAASTTSTLTAIANGGNTSAGVSSALSPNSVLTFNAANTTGVAKLNLRADSATTFNTAGVANTVSNSQTRTTTIDVGNNGSGTGQTLTLGGAWSLSAVPLLYTVNVTSSNGYKLAIGSVTKGDGVMEFNPTTADLSIASLTVTNNGGAYRIIGSGNTTVGDLIRSPNSRTMVLEKSGIGTLTMEGSASTNTAANSGGYYVRLQAGTLNLNNTEALGKAAAGNAYYRELTISGGVLDSTTGSDMVIASNPELNAEGNFTVGGTRALTFTNSAMGLGLTAGTSRTVTVNGTSNAFTIGSIADGLTATAFEKAGTGPMVVNNVSFHTGGTTVSDGTLTVNGLTIGSSSQNGTTTAVAGTIMTLTVPSTTNLRVGQGVSGVNIAPGTFITSIVSGTVVTMSQAATAAGTATANFTEGSALGTGPVSVSANGTLAGNGIITGPVSITGTLSPGQNIDSLDTGALTFNDGGEFVAEINSTSVTADIVNVTGNLTLSGNPTLSLSDVLPTNLAGGEVFTLIDYSGTWNGGIFAGRPDDSTVTVGSNSYLLNYNDGTAVTLTAIIPEPSVTGLLGAVGTGLTLRRRRRLS